LPRFIALYSAFFIRTGKVEEGRPPALPDNLSLMEIPPTPVNVGVAPMVMLAEFPVLDEPVDGSLHSKFRAAPGENCNLRICTAHHTMRVRM
jgi:hypothetical protein